MVKRLFIALGLLIAGAAGFYLAAALSRLVPQATSVGQSHTYVLLYQPAAWMIPLAAMLGIAARSLFKHASADPQIKAGKVLRHDGHMFFFHWCNAAAVFILAFSGLMLGPGWLPRAVHTPQTTGYVLNLHFVGIVLFCFALAYIAADFFIKASLQEHLPGSSDLKDTISYYTGKLTGSEPPAQAKFLASEKLTFPVWIVLFAGILVTGAVKTANHLWAIPAQVMPAATWAHDMLALCLLALVAAHIVLGALVPWSWPLLRSMVTGYMDPAYLRRHHSRWHEQLHKENQA